MDRVLSIDPSGTGISGLFFANGTEKEFYQCQNTHWKDHLHFIIEKVKEKQPTLLLFEDTNYIHQKTKDGLSLFRLLGAIEGLTNFFTLEIKSVNVLKVKEMTKKLLANKEQITNLTYQIGRGKGWMFTNKRISIHQLEAYLVYYLFTRKN